MKKVVRLKQSPLYDFRFRNASKGSIKQTRSNVSALLNKVSALEHDRFMQISPYTVYLQIPKPNSHCVKSDQIRSYFGSVFSCIRTEYGPEITPYLDTFHAVS